MSEVTIIGIDLAKRVFQLHGARADGSVVFRKKLSRGQLLVFFAQQPNCVVAMEACATAHGWGRELEKLGHSVRLIPPVHVKPGGGRFCGQRSSGVILCGPDRPDCARRPSQGVQECVSAATPARRPTLPCGQALRHPKCWFNQKATKGPLHAHSHHQ